jgi:polysaccharide export outer membrane protein
MNILRCLVISICFLPFALGYAQPTAAKPVLSATPAPAPPPAAVAVTPNTELLTLSPNYIIGADDSIQITVWKEPQLSATLPVRPDGKITLPLLNDITAAGFTPMQLEADITARLTKFINDPVVSVSLIASNSKRIFLIGEVGHAGVMSITPGMTILQAIASAGLTPYANKKHIYILRGDPAKQQKVFFDYNKAVKKGDMQGVTLVPGDTIVVP